MFGTAGLPHILMRFFTVSDAQAARKSVFYATGLIAYFYPHLHHRLRRDHVPDDDPSYFKVGPTGLTTRSRTLSAEPTWPRSISRATGGSLFLGFISAVSFATILAVVAGLTLAGASAVSHDLRGGHRTRARFRTEGGRYLEDLCDRDRDRRHHPGLHLREPERSLHGRPRLLRSPRAATSRFCSCPFSGKERQPAAPCGGLLGLVSAVVMVVLSKAVWVQTFGFPKEVFPYDNPAIFSMPIAFLGIWAFSKLDASQRRKAERSTTMPSIFDRRPASEPPSPTCMSERFGNLRLPVLPRPKLRSHESIHAGLRRRQPAFDRLTQQEIEELRAVLDIGYFRPREIIVRPGTAVGLPAVVIKGAVEVRDGAPAGRARAKDSFDSRAVVQGRRAKTSSPLRRRSAISSRSTSSAT